MALEVIRKGERSEACPIPLLFVHGAWHGAWCWDEYFLDYFAGLGYECLALSLRGHGASPGVKKMNLYRIADYVEDVAAVAATLDAPPIVIGHSMGGLTTQHFLAKHPATAAVLLGSVPPGGVKGVVMNLLKHHPMRFMAANLFWNLYILVNSTEKARALFYSDGVSDADVARFVAPLTNESYLAFIDMLLLDLPKPGRVSAPVKVIGGELDTVFPPADVEATAKFYNTTASIYPDTAHNLMLEPRWQDVADEIHSWIQAGFKG